MEHIGIDVHKMHSQICILTEDGELIERQIRMGAPAALPRGTGRNSDLRCYCGTEMLLGVPNSNPQQETLDHKIPLSRGGRHEVLNWCLACRNCNQRKHTKTAEEFVRRT